MGRRIDKDVRVSQSTHPSAKENGSLGVMVAVMGATGTGKSTFVKLLTDDPNIVIGYEPDSETIDIVTAGYVDRKTGLLVTLIDTPGFDDSRAGVGDVDILTKIANFLQAEDGRKLNGIIYMHRISDPRVGGVSRKNLRLFEKLCGADKLGNVRIVTTNWGRVGEQEGRDREASLANGAFKPLIDAGAVLVRQDKNLESARSIMADLIPKPAVTIQIQNELNAGTSLIATGAGTVINEELKELMEHHKKEIVALKKEMEKAAKAKHEALRAELAGKRTELENKLARAEEGLKMLERMLIEERIHKHAKVSQPMLPIAEDDGSSGVIVAVMGATGTGKSTFVNLLTENSEIIIGHKTNSKTGDVDTAHYVDDETGLYVTLIDTPGFEDSYVGVSDVDIVGKVANYMQEEGGRKLNGIIYMHRISDLRVGGATPKNLWMFENLCGRDKLGKVRIVTTNWGRVGEQDGRDREAKLANGAFKPFLDAGAILVRWHDKDLESARSIMADVISKDARKIRMHDELDAGTALIAAGAGAVIDEQERLGAKDKKAITAFKEEKEDRSEREMDEALKAELANAHRELENKIAHSGEDQKRSERMIMEERSKSEEERKKAEQERIIMARKHAEIQANLGQVQRKNEIEATEVGKTAERIREEVKRAEEERAKLVAEMKRARMVAEMEGAREKAALERAESEKKAQAQMQETLRHRREEQRRLEEQRSLSSQTEEKTGRLWGGVLGGLLG